MVVISAVAPFIGPAIQGVQAIGSGIGGKQAAKKGDALVQQQQDIYGRMAEGNLGTLDNLMGMMQGYQNPDLANRVLTAAQGLGGTLTGIADTASGQLGAGGYMNQAGQFDNFSFDPVNSTLAQTREAVTQMGDRARTQASDLAALNARQQEGMLDSALAARGFSRDSGTAAAALAGFGQQAALQRSSLESQLADQAAQAGLQAGQFDASNALQLAGLGSQYNLGMNQLRSNTNLALQQLNDQQAMQRAQLQMGAAQSGFDALQGTYSQNYLAPMLSLANNAATVGSYMGGYGQSGMDNLLNYYKQGAQQGGAGQGAGLGGLVSGLTSAITGKQGGGPQMSAAIVPNQPSGFGVSIKSPWG